MQQLAWQQLLTLSVTLFVRSLDHPLTCAVFKKFGDLTQRFVDSCRKHGLIPGVYYLGWGNFHMNITTRKDGTYDCQQDTPQTRAFEKMSLCHLEELYQNYGGFAVGGGEGMGVCLLCLLLVMCEGSNASPHVDRMHSSC